jgi:leucine-rich PPR motif-containing protein
VTPNVVVFSSLVYGLCTVDRWEKAEELFFEMLAQGIHPDTVFFNTIMCNLCIEGRVKEALRLIELMERVGVRTLLLSIL